MDSSVPEPSSPRRTCMPFSLPLPALTTGPSHFSSFFSPIPAPLWLHLGSQSSRESVPLVWGAALRTSAVPSFGREECAGSSGVPRRTASAHSGVGKRGWGWSGHVPLSLWASRPEFVMVECWTGSLGPQTLEPPTVSYHQPVTTFGAGYSSVRRALEGPSTLEAGGKGVERGLR